MNSMRIASALENALFLNSPNFQFPGEQKSVLLKYGASSIQIAKIAVEAANKSKSSDLLKSEKSFKWIIQACGFALRIDDGRSHESIFNISLNLYLDWLKNFPFECGAEVKERYVRLMMVHISQIFVNPSYKFISSDFVKKMQLILNDPRPPYSEDTWSVIIRVLFCCISDLALVKENYTDISGTALDCLANCECYPDPFWAQFDQQLKHLFTLEAFRIVWLNKFSDIYLALLEKRKDASANHDLASLTQIVQFFRKKIDTEFGEADKQKAFTNIVFSWTKFSDRNSGYIYNKWQTDEIKEMFLPWFSLNVEWKKEESQSIHPIFLLVKMGEKEKTPELHNIACSILKKTIKEPKGNHTDLYWYLPYNAYFFLVKNQDLLDEIKEDLISYVQEFNESQYKNDPSLCVHVIFLMMLLIERNKDEQTLQTTIAQLVLTEKADFSVIITFLISLLFINNSRIFWNQVNNCFHLDNFKDIMDTIALISGFSPHLNGSKFAALATLDSSIWDYLNSPLSKHQLQRFLLSLIFLSEGSDYFTVNPEDGARLLEYVSRPNNDRALKFFLKMARLSIICGGGTMEMPDNLKGKSRENYITRSYVVSVVDKDCLMIRHGLGFAVYEVKDLGGRSLKQEYVELPSVAKPTILPEAQGSYESECEPDPELLSACEQMDAMFSSNCEFEKYVEPNDPTNVSDAHSLLCDIGFISAYSESNMKRVPQTDLVNIIEKQLDIKEPSPLIKIPILQIIDSKLAAQPTDALKNLLDDFKDIHKKVCRFSFVTSFEESFDLASRYGFLVLLNETPGLLNPSCKELYYNVIVALTPTDDDHYFVNLMNRTAPMFGKHKIGNMSYLILRRNLAKLVSLMVILYYSSPTQFAVPGTNEAVEEQSKGLECFVSGFKSRIDIIQTAFTRNQDGGKNPLLLEITNGYQ